MFSDISIYRAYDAYQHISTHTNTYQHIPIHQSPSAVCEGGRERDRETVAVCKGERERDRETVSASKCLYKGILIHVSLLPAAVSPNMCLRLLRQHHMHAMCVCVCVCVCVFVCVCVCVWISCIHAKPNRSIFDRFMWLIMNDLSMYVFRHYSTTCIECMHAYIHTHTYIHVPHYYSTTCIECIHTYTQKHT